MHTPTVGISVLNRSVPALVLDLVRAVERARKDGAPAELVAQLESALDAVGRHERDAVLRVEHALNAWENFVDGKPR